MKLDATAGVTWAVVLATVVALPSRSAGAQDQTQRQSRTLARSVKAGQEVGLGYAARWNAKCEPIIPKLTIARPPAHGSLCGRSIMVTTQRNVSGDDQSCGGKRMRALQLIYMPHGDYVGTDQVDYVTELPRFQLTTHVDIQVEPGNAATRQSIPNDEIAPGKPGDAIVPCAPHMSQTTSNRMVL